MERAFDRRRRLFREEVERVPVDDRDDMFDRHAGSQAGAFTAALRAENGRSKRNRVRLVCRPCRRRITLLYGGKAVQSGASVTWRCDRCGRSYPVTVARIRTELDAAMQRGDRVIELPL